MNREERSQIRRMVLNARRILEEELDGLLRLYGLLPDRIVPVPGDRAAVHEQLKLAVERERQGPAPIPYPQARQRYVRQSAFTLLNRLLALRVAEANGLILETITPRPEYGDRSRRERDLADAEPELGAQPEPLAHAALRQAFAELRHYIPQLFGSDEPYVLLLPRLPAYRRLRAEFAALPEGLWKEFETLGWAYQFFNSEEREEIRRRLRRNPRPRRHPAPQPVLHRQLDRPGPGPQHPGAPLAPGPPRLPPAGTPGLPGPRLQRLPPTEPPPLRGELEGPGPRLRERALPAGRL